VHQHSFETKWLTCRFRKIRHRLLIRRGCASLASLLSMVVIAGGLAPTAAASSNPVLQQCASGSLAQQYSIGQLRQALSLLTAAEKQYTSCEDVIQQALATAAAKGRTGRPTRASSGSFLPAPVIVILVFLVLTAVTLAAVAVRRRRNDYEP
jgi:hypothetical protein